MLVAKPEEQLYIIPHHCIINSKEKDLDINKDRQISVKVRNFTVSFSQGRKSKEEIFM